MILASPGKSLYISTTLGSAIHHPNPPPPPPPPPVCLSFSAGMLPGKIQRRWRASLFDWLAGEEWAWPSSPYINIVAGETAELLAAGERKRKRRGQKFLHGCFCRQ